MIYQELHRQIKGGGAPADISAWAIETLSDIQDGRLPLTAIRHPLGFLCFPVERTGDYGVCIHVWLPGLSVAAPVTSLVHAHSWDLLSHVLCGSVRNETLRVMPEPDRPSHRLYEIRSQGAVDEIRPTPGLVRAQPHADQEFKPGESYTLPAGAFHSTLIPSDEWAATVALGRTAPGGIDLSLGPIDGASRHHLTRETCGPEETVRAVSTALRWLGVDCPT